MFPFIYSSAAAAAASLQSCPILCNPRDGSPPGSPVPGILQARTLEWVAISFSSAWKWKVKVKSLSRVWLLATPWTAAYQLLCPWDFPGKSTGMGCHCLLWYTVLENANSSTTLENRWVSGCLGRGQKRERVKLKRSIRKHWGGMDIFIILMVVVSQMYTCIEGHQTIHFKYVQLILQNYVSIKLRK